jgi:hypothetical protein
MSGFWGLPQEVAEPHGAVILVQSPIDRDLPREAWAR